MLVAYRLMECRPGCAACCIAISISSPIPGMPNGKPAGTLCVHLTDAGLCCLFGRPERPRVCVEFTADREICGANRQEALQLLSALEARTRPRLSRKTNDVPRPRTGKTASDA